MYGVPRMIFPIGDFDFIWSKNISDLYVEILSFSGRSALNWKEFAKFKGYEVGDNFNIFKFREIADIGEMISYYGEYQDTDLKAGIQSSHEIMLWCKQYYYVEPNLLGENK